ncbi:hypothetical protein RclHR1_03120020 [Rhizophagus clarus]|uniref:Uncharacterized protein n=1 Tax=Rhizophagus clarus TaxID=94130 RepID=A0A2Z6R782_9GLOM|nr:hypothetical protein RclHR1_03120020 [Rhizophagus clarus]GES74031.1 hypothetical protein GLOIN_2v1496894 [Rhizophagus clarus]
MASSESSSDTQNLNIQIANQNSISNAQQPTQTQEELRQHTESLSNSNMTSESSSRNVTFPTIPQRAFARIRATTSIPSSSSPTSAASEYLPSYSIVIRDMPPTYPFDQNDLELQEGEPSRLSRDRELIESLVHLEAPILPQEYWPITKSFYVYGFLIWPLWLIGTLYIFLGNEYRYRDQEQGTTTNEENANNNNNNNNGRYNTGRLKWAQRCLFNLLIITTLIAYVAVALNKTKGKFY